MVLKKGRHMEKNRVLGKDMKITKLGYGAWAVGNGWTAEKDAFAVLESYISHGGNFIDTAQGYKTSEERIGKFLKERGYAQQVVIASKTSCGGTMDTVQDITSAVEDSLRKLQRDYIDLYYFHSPPSDVETMESALYVMEDLVKQGKIRGIGASIKGPSVNQDTVDLCKQYIDTGKLTAIQLIYSLMRQKNQEIFHYAQEHSVALVGRTSLESGFLTGKYSRDFRFPPEDYRSKWNSKFELIWDLVEQAQGKYTQGDIEAFKAMVLKFAMHPEAITSTIVGARNQVQMEQLVAMSQGTLLDTALLASMKEDFQETQEVCNPD